MLGQGSLRRNTVNDYTIGMTQGHVFRRRDCRMFCCFFDLRGYAICLLVVVLFTSGIFVGKSLY